MRTRDEIFKQVLVRNNRTTTDGFISDTILKEWFRDAHTKASSHRKWPFTEGRVSTTFSAKEEWNFEGYKADSFRLVRIGGYSLRKLNFEDYQIFRETEPDSDERVCSDFGRTLFINPNVDLAGTLTAWGQYKPYVDITDETGLTVFSDWDEEGNEAVVEFMTGYLKRREHLPDEAVLHDQRGVAKLEQLWKRILDEQYQYQTHLDRGGMFKRVDILGGDLYEELYDSDQF